MIMMNDTSFFNTNCAIMWKANVGKVIQYWITTIYKAVEPLAVSQASSPSNLLALVLLYPYFSFNSPNRHSSPPLSLWTRCPLPWWASDGLLLSIQSWTKHWPTYLRWLPACSTLQLLSASLLIAFFHGSPQWCDVMPSATPRGLSVHEAGGWVSLVSLHILHTPTLLAPN